MFGLFFFRVIVRDDERAFLTRDGRFERLLESGRFVSLDAGRRLKAEVVKVVRAELPADRALLIARTHPAVAERNFAIVQAGANQVAIVSFDGEPRSSTPTNSRSPSSRRASSRPGERCGPLSRTSSRPSLARRRENQLIRSPRRSLRCAGTTPR